MISAVVVALPIFVGCSNDTGGDQRVELRADPATVKTGSTSAITVKVLDDDGETAPDGTAIALSVSPALGTLPSAAPTTVEGEAKTVFTAGATTGQAVITATSGGASATMTLTIGARVPATIQLSADPSTVNARAASTVTARVLDADGEAVPDGTAVDLSVSPALGTLANTALPTVAGKAKTLFTAGATTGQAVIIATSGAASASLSLTIQARDPATIRIVVDDNTRCCSGIPCIADPVTGYLQPMNGGDLRWMPAVGPGEIIEVPLDDAGKRYRWVFKAC